MIDRFNDILPYLEQLPQESQEEIMAYIEVLIDALEREAIAHGRLRETLPEMPAMEPWSDPVGAWNDLPDTLLEDLDQLRHAVPPTPPIERI